MTIRLPAHLEIGSLIRLAETHGGSAMVLSKGERDAGTILLVTMFGGEQAQLFERMPQLDGSRAFVPTKSQDPEKPWEFSEYLERRGRQDPDTWILEIDVDNPERFIELLPN
ncbi:MAG: DUF1491 family protein [Pseudomonadota bacterium]